MTKPGTVAEWRSRLKRWRESGDEVLAFCKAEGVSKQSFYAWRRKLEGGPDAPTVDFVQVAGHEPIELEAGGFVVRVRAGFDEEALRAVLDLLAARS